jgi:hypothetical protein
MAQKNNSVFGCLGESRLKKNQDEKIERSARQQIIGMKDEAGPLK